MKRFFWFLSQIYGKTLIAGNRNALNGIGIAIALATFSQVTAGFTIISYSVKIFQKLGTSMDPHLSSFILAISLIFGSLASTYLADKLGRKFLNAISLSGSAFGLFATSLYHYLSLSDFDVSAFEWAPIVSLSFVIFISSAGIWGLALVSAIEYLPNKVCRFVSLFLLTHLMCLTFCFYRFVRLGCQ